MGHGHPVRLDQDVAGQPGVDVHQLHGGHIVEARVLRLVVDRPRDVPRARVARPHRDPRRLVFAEHAGVADVAVPQRGGRALQEAPALDPGRDHHRGLLDRGPAPVRQPLAGPDHAGLVVDRVPAEQLVGALAGQHDLDVLARLAGHEPQRDGGGIGHRFVEVPDDLREVPEELLPGDHVGNRPHADGGRRLLRPVDLAVPLALEPHGEREQVRPVLGGQRADRRRVDAAGQERPERSVAAQVDRDRVAHRGENRARGRLAGLAGWPQVGAPEAVDVDRPARPGDHGVAGRQHLDGRRDGVRRGHVLEGQVPAQRGGVQVPQFPRLGERLALRGEAQPQVHHAGHAGHGLLGRGGPGWCGRRGRSPRRTLFMRYARPIRLSGRMPTWPPGRPGGGGEPAIRGYRRVSLLRGGRLAGRPRRRMPAAARPGREARAGCSAVAAAGRAVGLAAGDRAWPAVDAVVEGLDAERVPGAEQFARPGVPDGDGVHAAEPVYHVLADQGVGLEQHLGVAVGPQGDPLLPQFGGQFDVVVDLPVEEHPEAAVGRPHRLMPGQRQVQDRQPPEAERDIRVRVHAIVVRPAMVDPVQGFCQPGLVRARLKGQCQAAGDSTHRRPQQCPRVVWSSILRWARRPCAPASPTR